MNLKNRRITPNSVYQLFGSKANEPKVYLVKGQKALDQMKEAAGINNGAFVLISLMWRLTLPSLFRHFRITRDLKRRGYRPLIMCNEESELLRCRLAGVPAVLMNQNQFIMEDSLRIPAEDDSRIDYDAFYAAQAKPFKRLYLASKIERLFVLTYSCPSNESGENDLALVEPLIRHASWNPSYVQDFEKVVELMHCSGVALALSKSEGAMWAVVEALLCGIPVVSTPSVGGRDRYFHAETAAVVDETPEAVLQGVRKFRDERPDPARVRELTLNKIYTDRCESVAFFQKQLLPKGLLSDREVYDRLFSPGPARTPMGKRGIA